MYVCVCMGVITIASKRFVRLNSNLEYMLQVTVRGSLLILVNVGCIVFLQKYKKNYYKLRPKESNS